MGSVAGMLGVAGGSQGTGVQGPTSATIFQPTTTQQAQDQYQQAQQALVQQQNFLNAVNAQNGLQNQTNVYNQLQGVANGTGPNPAQAQLAQATAANNANQASLMAGQRGAGQNAGLIARQAAMQGANNQQNAAGQAASMQAQQSLGALGQMGNMANQQAGQQAAATGANTQATQAEQGNILNSIGAQNNANVNMQGGINNANAGIQSSVMQGQRGLIGGLMGGAGAALGLARGGQVPSMSPQMYTEGGGPQQSSFSRFQTSVNNPSQSQSFMPSMNGGSQDPMQTGMTQLGAGIHKLAQNQAAKGIAANENEFADADVENTAPELSNIMPAEADSIGMMAFKGGKVPAMVSPGERYIPPKELKAVESGKKAPMKAGEKIPGKAKVKGAVDSYKNDIVPKDLEEGGLVLPRSVTQSKHPHWEAKKFVSQWMAKQGRMPASKKR